MIPFNTKRQKKEIADLTAKVKVLESENATLKSEKKQLATEKQALASGLADAERDIERLTKGRR